MKKKVSGNLIGVISDSDVVVKLGREEGEKVSVKMNEGNKREERRCVRFGGSEKRSSFFVFFFFSLIREWSPPTLVLTLHARTLLGPSPTRNGPFRPKPNTTSNSIININLVLGRWTMMSIVVPCGGAEFVRGKKDEVFVAAVALRAPKGPPQLLLSSAYSLNLWDLQHFLVIIKPQHLHSHQALVYDFQPKDPESIYSVFAVVCGRSLPGIVVERKLRKVPNKKCWFVGFCEEDNDVVHRIREFNHSWGTHLTLGSHDCRHYTNGLVEHLTGEKQLLARLRLNNY